MKASYGIDALPVIRNVAVIGVACLIVAVVVRTSSTFIRYFFATFTSTGIALLLSGSLMTLYSLFGKFRHRDRMLKMIEWRGDEKVLDVGTGRGLLMIGAAKMLDSGKAFGIDIFNSADLSGNNLENVLNNVELEGVAAKVEVRNEDAREMSFADASFDVILSNLCLHNIPEAEGRELACREIVRVLKAGGTALISDFQKTKQYRKVFQACGLEPAVFGPYLFDTYPPLRIVKVQKPIVTEPSPEI